jgi:twitching motility protein PilT
MEIQRFQSLIEDIIKNRISDLHFSSGEPPYIRNHVGDMSPVQAFGKVNEQDLDQIIQHLLGRPFTEPTIDISYAQSGTRFRVNISRTINGVTIAMRTIPSTIPEPEAIGLQKYLLDLTIAEK